MWFLDRMETFRLSTFALQTALIRRWRASQSNLISLIPLKAKEGQHNRDNHQRREKCLRAHDRT